MTGGSPSGTQHEIRFEDHRAVVTEVGAGVAAALLVGVSWRRPEVWGEMSSAEMRAAQLLAD